MRDIVTNTVKPRTFSPVKVEFVIETKEELNNLWDIFINKCDNFYPLWSELDEIKREQL